MWICHCYILERMFSHPLTGKKSQQSQNLNSLSFWSPVLFHHWKSVRHPSSVFKLATDVYRKWSRIIIFANIPQNLAQDQTWSISMTVCLSVQWELTPCVYMRCEHTHILTRTASFSQTQTHFVNVLGNMSTYAALWGEVLDINCQRDSQKNH